MSQGEAHGVRLRCLDQLDQAAQLQRLGVRVAARSGLVPGMGGVAACAGSWTVSDDGTVYDFRLRNDVKFHTTPWFKPSRTLDADDVLFSFQRMLYPAHAWHKTAAGGYPHAQSLQLGSLSAYSAE